ncbi:hypothetical protein MIND_00651800 [Mycena indigotica]|uniref:Uncharacterized protein n=1 Tax=Mycena indigotica TaxID=2126181 RepID=A0A8H6STQ5_9AGAR|nr:uncharacterized protein MIND_00651800 [Mycena indigotica]KAF7304197.1 hypothetical protein MIND_00651800 [Mycena indigotica]
MSSATEATPLLVAPTAKPRDWFSAYHRILLATLLLSTTFWFTSTPVIYVFRVFSCQEYYADPSHPPYEGTGDACALPAIEATTSSDIGIMGLFTSISGTLNLLLTTWQIRHWGLRSALIQQTLWPAFRNLCQIYATFVGGRTAITIIQTTQMITILGGGLGYNLAVNSYITEVVEAEGRTAAFGVLAGMNMLGTAIGFIGGGLAGSLINITAPFQITFCLLVGSTVFTRLMLPYVAPTTQSDAKTPSKGILSSFSALLVFRPVAYFTPTGTKKWYYGLTLLAFGTFAGALATSYVPLMLQLTATNRYDYGTAENGYLMASLSLSRALFLTFAFPKIISSGRKWYSSTNDTKTPPSPVAPLNEPEMAIPATLEGGDAPLVDDAAAHVAPGPTDQIHGSRFDLVFLQWSMVVDAVLTALVALTSRAWHINLAAVVLPLASGTAPACKGVLMDMLPTDSASDAEALDEGTAKARAAARRADALAGISIIETFSWISTVAIFGQLFAVLSAMGRPNLVFFCNSGLAVFAAVVLFAVRFPPGRK